MNLVFSASGSYMARPIWTSGILFHHSSNFIGIYSNRKLHKVRSLFYTLLCCWQKPYFGIGYHNWQVIHYSTDYLFKVLHKISDNFDALCKLVIHIRACGIQLLQPLLYQLTRMVAVYVTLQSWVSANIKLVDVKKQTIYIQV